MHHPFEMAVRTFGMNVGDGACLPSSERQPKQQDSEVFDDIFENDVQYSFVPVVVPICGDVVE